MKIGIFSDVHGNQEAFKKVFSSLKEHRCDAYIFAGDLCGYYYGQNEVVEMMQSLPNLWAVRGNHDEWFLRCLESPSLANELTGRYGHSYEMLVQSASPETLRFIKAMPDKIIRPELGLAIFHGSPWGPTTEYIYPTDAVDRFETLPYRFVVLGHTHHPMHRKAGMVNIINPGSCGQPRDRKPPCYAILDTETESVEFTRIPYDPAPLIEAIRRQGESNPYLAEVLTR